MEIQEKEEKTYHVKLELPFDVRALGWAIYHLLLGFCLGVAVHNLFVVLGRWH